MTYLLCSLAFALGWGVGMTIADRRTVAKLAAARSDRDAAREALAETMTALEACLAEQAILINAAEQSEREAVQAQAALANRIARASERGRKAAATRKARRAVIADEVADA